ncbi:MAG: AAA domain-containing protein [Bacteroidota bacterium]
MKEILHTYKLRLTNLSQANRSLKLGKLSKRKDIDLCQLGHLNGFSAEELLRRLIADKDLNLISRPDPRHEPTNLADRRLTYIYREANTLFEEVGTYDLFVGYPFVEGKFLEGTVARCPLLLFPVRLQRKLMGRPRWKLERIKDEPVIFNRTFFLAYEQYQHIRFPDAFWEEEIFPNKDKLKWVNGLYEKIKQYELEVNFNPRLFDQEIQAFPNYLKATMDNFRSGVLSFQPHAVLGIFPQADSALLQDYERMEKHPQEFEFGDLLGSQVNEGETYIREEDRYFVTPVDQSQEASLLQVKNGNSIVVHGPPGTGKSQVIVNMIADSMAHGKKVLLVSQKRAALDVVYKRLEGLGLGKYAILVHDFRHDRKAIYGQIQELIEAIPDFQREIVDLNITQWEYTYQLLCRQVDQTAKKYEELYQALTQTQPYGISVHDLYLKADRHAELLPVETFASQATQAELEGLQDLLPLLNPYQDFFQPEYPWFLRHSLHEADWNQREEMASQLAQLPFQLQSLNEGYITCRKSWKTWPITRIEENDNLLEAYEQVDESLAKPSLKKGVEEILIDHNPKELESVLDSFGERIAALDSCHILDEGHWRIYGSLKKHLQVYDTQKEQKLRLFSLPFQRARWFLKKVLAESKTELTEGSFTQLKGEGAKFSALHSLYAAEHEREFLGDFPLLNSRTEKYAWVEQKKKQWAIWHATQKLPENEAVQRPRLKQGKIDQEAWGRSMEHVQALNAYTQVLKSTGSQWKSILHPQQAEILWQSIDRPESVEVYLQELSSTFKRDGEELHNLDRLIHESHPSIQEVLPQLYPYLINQRPVEEIQQQIQNSVYSHWIIQAERMHPVLSWVSTRNWEEQAQLFGKKLAESRKKVVELVLRRIKERIVEKITYNRLKNPVTYRDILHQVTKKRRIWSVRKLIQETWETGLSELTPCWMASPESASAIFPMEPGFFDLVIFDEASQCFVERALTITLRGKQVVIAGDEKQLQPLNLYQVRYEEEEIEFVEDEVALEVESILDLAKTRLLSQPLNWHYRSQDAALINFSNQAFYRNSLQVFPSAKKNPTYTPALEWVQVRGFWRNNRNLEEADRIIQLVLELLQQPDNPTLGIVTFNYHQQELIKDRLEETLAELLQRDESRYYQLQACMDRREQGEFQGLFVKNIENVQGDERDIILFSIGYAHSLSGRMTTQFGLLNQSGGANRLNVAITRARKKIYVVCSFRPEELNVENAKHEGPKLFKAYLQYVYATSTQREALPIIDSSLDSLELLSKREETRSETFWEGGKGGITAYLAQKLQAAGYHVEPHVGDTTYRLDLAVKAHSDDPTYLLGIECEGPYYFRGASAREREIYRLEGLRQRGWRVHRVWARNFWWNREKEVKKVLEKLGGERRVEK